MSHREEGVALFYGSANVVMQMLLRGIARWRVEGRGNVPPRGPLIVVSNHSSNVDPPLVGASLPRLVHFLAKPGLFEPVLFRPFIRAYGAVPAYRRSGYPAGFERALELLQQDKVLGIFPEGSRNKGQLKRAMPGVALVALRSGAPILPVAITGTEQVRHLRRLFTRPKITVRIGEPFSLPLVEGRVGKAQLTSMTDLIMERVAALLPDSYRGYYAIRPRERAPQEDPMPPKPVSNDVGP